MQYSRRLVIQAGLASSIFTFAKAAGASAKEAPPYQWIDGSGLLKDIVDRRLAPADATAAFQASIIPAYSQAYQLVGSPGASEIRDYLGRLEREPVELLEVGRAAAELFDRFWRQFDARLPLKRGSTVVYLLPAPAQSLAGAVRFDGNRDVVVLGSEVATFLPSAGLSGATFVHHELGHLYHQQQNDEIRQASRNYFARDEVRLHQMLWLEGFGVYLSKLLNPEATSFDLLRSRNLETEMNARWAQIIEICRAELDSSDLTRIDQVVYDGDPKRGVPPKAGYFVGFRIAEWLGQTKSPSELARLRGRRLRRALLRALDSLSAPA